MLIKNSPLSGIYRRHSANTVEVSGWLMADDFGNPEKEQKHLQEQCVYEGVSLSDQIDEGQGRETAGTIS